MATFRHSPVSEFAPRRRSLLLGGASTAALATLASLFHGDVRLVLRP